ncbi:hypothetical protein KIPB_013385, partial [Kipferlia bialata]
QHSFPPEVKPLLTDRNAYIAYLERQIEKVSASILTVNAFSERIEQVQSGMNMHEERLLNMAKLIQMLQGLHEAGHTDTKEALTAYEEALTKVFVYIY